jgi:ribonuclease HII
MKTDYNIMKTDCGSLEIIDDSSDEEYIIPKIKSKKIKVVKETSKHNILKGYYNEDNTVIEIGVDEVGRGPLFGRVYTAAVILPKDDNFDFSKVKDSKKFYSKKKLEEAAEYVKKNALMWHVSYEDEKKIDEINILQATQLSMHNSINEVCKKYNKQMNDKGKREKKDYSFNLLIDGNYFNPITTFNKETNKIEFMPYVTIEGGDNKYASIAAASILAKVERDKYINELCVQNPELINHYGIDSNKGYGAKKHIEGIKEHGITIWHRRSFAPCKNYI